MNGRGIAGALLGALISIILLNSCGNWSGDAFNSQGRQLNIFGQRPHTCQIQDKPLPDVADLDDLVGAMRSVSTQSMLTTQGWEAYINNQYGTNGTSGLNVESSGTSITLRAYDRGEYAYAVFGQAVGADPKPLQALIDSEVCAFGGGRDDEVPLCYYISVADYTLNCWRWFGPFGENDVVVRVNSEALKSRFKSPADNFYLCILASNGSRAASALSKEGYVAAFPFDTSRRHASAGEEDPGGLTVQAVITTVDTELDTLPAMISNMQAAPDTSGVNLSWDASEDVDVDSYQLYRDDLDTPDPPQYLAGVPAPTVQYADTTGVAGKNYYYFVCAHNPTGVGGNGLVGSGKLLVPPSATASETEPDFITVTWPASPGAVGYEVYRGNTEADTPVSIAQVDALTLNYDDTVTPLGVERWYWVRALGEDFDSALGTPDIGRRAQSPPTADLSANVTQGDAPLDVNFDASGSYDLDGSIDKIEWDWEGDGTYDLDSGIIAFEFHSYSSPGVYNATVRVTDNDGLTDTASITIDVTSAEWTHTWGGGSTDEAEGVAVGPDGNLIVMGWTDSFGAGGRDVCIMKYSPDGNILWKKTWGGGNNDEARKMVLDASGNAYVAGFTYSFGASEDAFLLKYDTDGNLLMQKHWGSGNRDEGYSVALDTSGNIFLTGWSDYYGSSNTDAFLLKYSSSGTLLWQKLWGGPNLDYGYDLGTDPSGNVYVSGPTWSYSAGQTDVFSLKYDNDGNLLWQRMWGGILREETTTVAVDGSGNFYITGFTGTFGVGAYDVFTFKYDTNGNLQWDKVWGGASDEFSEGIGFDAGGNIVIAGHTASFGVVGNDAVLLAYDVNGNPLWQQKWGAAGYQAGGAVCSASGSKLYFAGRAPNTTGSWAALAGSYADPSATTSSPTGNETSVSCSEGDISGTENIPGGVVDTGGGGNDMLLIKVDTSAW